MGDVLSWLSDNWGGIAAFVAMLLSAKGRARDRRKDKAGVK